MQPALEAALAKHEEAVAKLAAFKKKYTSVKNKAKRVQHYVATMNDEQAKFYKLSMLNSVRLAENKFELIDKKWNRFRQHDQRYCNASLKLLKGPAMEPNMTRWHIGHVSGHARNADGFLREATDMLRIAKGHLDKVDDMKKSIEKYSIGRRPG